MKFKKTFLSIAILFSLSAIAQTEPKYPELTENMKRVDLLIPKIQDPENYRLEVRFGTEVKISECENTRSFDFNIKNLRKDFGLPNRYMYYYIGENQPIQILTFTETKECNPDKQITKKVLSDQNIFIEHIGTQPTPFFIPKTWTVEYRLWKVHTDFKTAK